MSEQQRNHWPKGLVRHLRVDDWTPSDSVFAIREDHNGGLDAGGTTDIHYTLVVHPRHAYRVEEYRHLLERNPEIGGLFSPERDL